MIFLDLHADRYFGLDADAERVVDNLIAKSPLSDPERTIAEGLKSSGLLTVTDRPDAPVMCRSLPLARSSLLDGALPPTKVSGVGRAALALYRSHLALKIFGLEHSLRMLSRRAKMNAGAIKAPSPDQTMAEFQRAATLVTAYDQCLPHSLALARALAEQGIAHSLVIGVHLRPFHAHCWVQQGDTLINDSVDVTREFSPILIQ